MSGTPSFSGSTRGGGRDRGIAGLVVVVSFAFVALAVVKPWVSASPASPTPGGPSAAVAGSPSRPTTNAPSPSPIPSPSLGTTVAPPLALDGVAGPLPVAFTTAAQPAPTAAWTGLRWRRLGSSDPLGLVRSITRWQHGFVAVGAGIGSPPTPVWTSTDGRSWQPLLFDTATTFWPGTDILSVGELRGALVAVAEVAEYCSQPCAHTYILPVVAWTSPDGRAWSPHVLPTGWLPSPAGAPPLVAFGPAGLLVASTGTGARLATSSDGVRWQALAATAFPARFELDALAATSTGYVAAGRWIASGSRSRAATIWSPDGRNWPAAPTLLPAPEPGTLVVGVGSTVHSLVQGADGLIAEGGDTEIPGSAWWWQSADGRSWRSLPGYPPVGPTGGLDPDGSLVDDGARMIAIRGGQYAAAWVSRDGVAWRRLSMTGDVPPGEPLAWTVVPGGILATNGSTSWFGEAAG